MENLPVEVLEEVFSYLDKNDLLNCLKVNKYWARILRNPWFWYKRMMQDNILSEMHQKEWSNFCDKLDKSDLTKHMTPGLKIIYEHLEDSVALNEVYPRVYQYAISALSANAPNIVEEEEEIMAPLIEYPETVKILKILAPLTDNPNAALKSGWPPIYKAAYNGNMEIVKILAPLTDDPNAPDKDGFTPIYHAAQNGHTEIVKILTPLLI